MKWRARLTGNSKLETRNTVEVSAALIFRDGKLLITRRHKDSHLGGLWEFPGGKREPGETFEQCLVREIREELGVEITVGELFEEISHVYDSTPSPPNSKWQVASGKWQEKTAGTRRKSLSPVTRYPSLKKSVHLKFFLCRLISGEPRPVDCAAVKWIGKPELDEHEFPAADARLLEKLKSQRFAWS